MAVIGFSHNDIWSYFLQTFTGEPDLTVTRVENNYITFKSSSLNLANLFKDPESIKSKVIHSYSHKLEAKSYLALNAQETIGQLVDAGFLQKLKVNLESGCQDNFQAKIVTCNIQTTSIFELKQSTEAFANLQSLFQSEDQVSNIMLGNNERLKEEDFTGENYSYGHEIIEVTSDLKNKSASVSIQYGKILSSAEQASIRKPEITSLNNVEQEHSIDKNILLSYAQTAIPSGVIYAQTSHGLQPILFQSMKSNKPNNFQSSSFDVILDLSASMDRDLPEVKMKLIELLSRIISVTDNWEIQITPFSSNIFNTALFSSSNKGDMDGLSKYINNLNTDSNTALYNAMYQVYSRIDTIDTKAADKNSVIFTITDGLDNESDKKSSDIIELAKLIRQKAPQSTIYNIGKSSYDKRFFDELSKNSASKTIHLDKVSDLEELYQEMDTINNCKVLYEFGSSQYAQCAAGDIFIPSFTVDKDTQVKVAGEVYNIGVE